MPASEPQEDNQTPQDPRSMTPGQRLAAQKEAKAKRKAAQRGAQGETAAQLAENVGRASSWASENKGMIWALVLAVVVISVGLTAWRIQGEQAAASAASALSKATETMVTPLEGDADSDAEQTFETSAARAQAALEQFREVISGYSGSAAAPWAHAGEGRALLALSKPSEALQAFEKAGEAEDASVELQLRALEGQGFALEAQDKLADAEARFAGIEKLGDGDYAPLGTYHVGRMALARDEKERAIEAFTNVMETLDRVAEDDEEVLQLAYVKEQTKQRLLELQPSVVADDAGGQAGMNFPGAKNLPPEVLKQLQKAAKSAPSSGSGDARE